MPCCERAQSAADKDKTVGVVVRPSGGPPSGFLKETRLTRHARRSMLLCRSPIPSSNPPSPVATLFLGRRRAHNKTSSPFWQLEFS